MVSSDTFEERVEGEVLKKTSTKITKAEGEQIVQAIANKLRPVVFEELGIEVKYAGKMLADMQKDGWQVLTF